MNPVIATALRLLSPEGPRGRLSILIFHRVHPAPDSLFPGEPDAERFEELLLWLREWFNFLPLPEAAARLRDGNLPGRAAAITFDDGYADNCQIALPILQRLGLHATFFIATGYLNGGRMWNDTVIETIRNLATPELDLVPLGLGRYRIGSIVERRESIEAILGAAKYLPQGRREEVAAAIRDLAGAPLPDDLMMTDAEVRRLYDAGMEIGAHTRTHPILANCPDDIAEREIADGRDDLASLLGRPVRLFAYPNGKPERDYRRSHVDMVRRMGFAGAVSTAAGAARAGVDPFQLPRFTPWAIPKWRFGLQMAQNLATDPLVQLRR